MSSSHKEFNQPLFNREGLEIDNMKFHITIHVIYLNLTQLELKVHSHTFNLVFMWKDLKKLWRQEAPLTFSLTVVSKKMILINKLTIFGTVRLP